MDLRNDELDFGDTERPYLQIESPLAAVTAAIWQRLLPLASHAAAQVAAASHFTPRARCGIKREQNPHRKNEGVVRAGSQQAVLRFVSPARRALLALLIASLLVTVSFVWQGAYGLSLSDEGFLWYGAQRVQAGEVPLRDFMSYDPGRYYWSAAWMAVGHDHGIMALRSAAAIFQLLGLAAALWLLARSGPNRDVPLLILSAFVLVAWMYPRHKLFDICLSIFLIALLTAVVEQPSRRRFLLAGIGLGLVAVFGRNHGVYGVVGVSGVIVYLGCRERSANGALPRLLYCIAGIVVGYLPMLLSLIAVPGFAAAFWASVRAIFERGTNLPLPVPWPWLVPVAELPLPAAAKDILTGVLFIAVLGYGLFGGLYVLARAWRQHPVAPGFVACSMLALPYAHYAFSRADLGHLAQGIFPLLLGVLLAAHQQPPPARWAMRAALLVASLLIMAPMQAGWQCRLIMPCVQADVAGDTLTVDPDTAQALAMLKSAADRYAPNGRSIVVSPMWPGAYAVLQRKSPMWEIYALFPATAEFQEAEIARIKAANPGLVLIQDVALDRRDDLRFSNTHPLIDRFVRDHFDQITVGPWSPAAFRFYRSR